MQPLHDVYQRYAADVYHFSLFLCGNPTEAFHGNAITFFMARDEPGSRLLWLSAVYLWFDYVRQGRRLETKLRA